jgi:hypothetical protein
VSVESQQTACCPIIVFNPEDGGNMILVYVDSFNKLYGFISQKLELFITTVVRTSNPAYTSNNVSLLCTSPEEENDKKSALSKPMKTENIWPKERKSF